MYSSSSNTAYKRLLKPTLQQNNDTRLCTDGSANRHELHNSSLFLPWGRKTQECATSETKIQMRSQEKFQKYAIGYYKF
jgi:hypothetical protein